MANTFSIILVIVTLVTGIVWAFEKWVWSKKRLEKLKQLEEQSSDLDEQTFKKLKTQHGG